MRKLDFRFCCLVGVDSVKRIPPTGNIEAEPVLTGRWKKALTPLFPNRPGQLAENFANEADVLRFTTRYGPLHNQLGDFTGKLGHDGSQSANKSRLSVSLPSFDFSEAEWRADLERFQAIWETLPTLLTTGRFQAEFPAIIGIENLTVRPDGFTLPVRGEFQTISRRLVFRAATLWELLLLDLLSVERERLKKCACPDCHSPYFVANHRAAKFCDQPMCKSWGRNQIKLKWWNVNRRGSKAPSTRNRGGKRGTQKAR
jgi:hypothetical protein